MLLAVDIGNTSTQLAVFDDGQLVVCYRLRTETFRSPDEYAVTLAQLLSLRGHRLETIREAAICCVVPQALDSLRQFLRTYARTDAFVLDHRAVLPIRLLIDNPPELGADRIANAVAAYERFRDATVVVDFGTATTFDVIDRDGAYRGGVIAPGIAISADALWHRAAQLPRVEIQRPPSVVGTNTIDSIRSGLYFGYLGLIEGTLDRLGAELGARPFVLATGGYAGLLSRGTGRFDAVDELVTLNGLLRVYELNRGLMTAHV